MESPSGATDDLQQAALDKALVTVACVTEPARLGPEERHRGKMASLQQAVSVDLALVESTTKGTSSEV